MEVVSWGPNRLDIVGRDVFDAMNHNAWDGSAWQSPWEDLGGVFTSSPAVASWGPNRLDVFGRGTTFGMFHKAWAGGAWRPSQTDWEDLGGDLRGPFAGRIPSVASWGPDRLDTFGIGTNGGVYRRAWDGSTWLPWENLGGRLSPSW
jgi:hypothetical protein